MCLLLLLDFDGLWLFIMKNIWIEDHNEQKKIKIVKENKWKMIITIGIFWMRIPWIMWLIRRRKFTTGLIFVWLISSEIVPSNYQGNQNFCKF